MIIKISMNRMIYAIIPIMNPTRMRLKFAYFSFEMRYFLQVCLLGSSIVSLNAGSLLTSLNIEPFRHSADPLEQGE